VRLIKISHMQYQYKDLDKNIVFLDSSRESARKRKSCTTSNQSSRRISEMSCTKSHTVKFDQDPPRKQYQRTMTGFMSPTRIRKEKQSGYDQSSMSAQVGKRFSQGNAILSPKGYAFPRWYNVFELVFGCKVYHSLIARFLSLEPLSINIIVVNFNFLSFMALHDLNTVVGSPDTKATTIPHIGSTSFTVQS